MFLAVSLAFCSDKPILTRVELNPPSFLLCKEGTSKQKKNIIEKGDQMNFDPVLSHTSSHLQEGQINHVNVDFIHCLEIVFCEY